MAYALKKFGICTIEEFLTKEQAKLVIVEFNRKLEAPTDSCDDGSTVVKRSTIDDFSSIPIVAEYILNNPQVLDLVRNAEGRKYDICDTWFDIGCNGDVGIGDSQKVMHTDNFYVTHKIWYFLDDVTLEHGPLVVTPGTSRFSLLRAAFEYINPLSYDSQNVAWRPSQRWQNILKLRPKVITVAANTLVIVNTHGFHRRGDAVSGMERWQIHFRVRFNPLKKIFSYVGESE